MMLMGAPNRTKPHSNRDAVLLAIRKVSGGEPTVSVEAAGKLLGLGRDASYAAAASGTLPTLKLCGRRWRVPVVALEKMLLGD
jgi:excisionase family DNA binding protein